MAEEIIRQQKREYMKRKYSVLIEEGRKRYNSKTSENRLKRSQINWLLKAESIVYETESK